MTFILVVASGSLQIDLNLLLLEITIIAESI